MTRHTPGPWFVEHTRTCGLRIVHGEADPETGFRDDVPVGRKHDDITDETRANVALMADATALLDAMAAVEPYLERDEHPDMGEYNAAVDTFRGLLHTHERLR